jgi:hypothetical protein
MKATVDDNIQIKNCLDQITIGARKANKLVVMADTICHNNILNTNINLQTKEDE